LTRLNISQEIKEAHLTGELAGIFVTDQECQIFQKQKRDAKITVSEIKYLGFCSHIDQMRPTI
jgi:hypothetical protein